MDELVARFLASARALSLSPTEHAMMRQSLLSEMKLGSAGTRRLQKDSASLALSSSEKANGRRRLLSFMRTHPAHGFSPVTLLHSLLPRRLASTAFFTTLSTLLLGGSLAYAAEGSLPGDFLYPIKVHVTEPIVSQLSVTPQKRTQWDLRVIERRLTEAEALDRRAPSKESRTILNNQMGRNLRSAEQNLENIPSLTERKSVREELKRTLKEHEREFPKLREIIVAPRLPVSPSREDSSPDEDSSRTDPGKKEKEKPDHSRSAPRQQEASFGSGSSLSVLPSGDRIGFPRIPKEMKEKELKDDSRRHSDSPASHSDNASKQSDEEDE
ncbi:MAG: DUF5667 domain-containing protein [Candidatus Peribacteraceae bacterium]|nr:DUF5667 domain-containing protein [Candidatus Peribacteraceae bacterium]MDD5074723.1 DUF5667 domain-containing protein [Candidatus Peribacteraceae bacterium]